MTVVLRCSLWRTGACPRIQKSVFLLGPASIECSIGNIRLVAYCCQYTAQRISLSWRLFDKRFTEGQGMR